VADIQDSTAKAGSRQDRKYKVNTAEELVQLQLDEDQSPLFWEPIHYLRELSDGLFYVGVHREGILDHADGLEVARGLLRFYETVSPAAIAELKYYLDLEEERRRAVQRQQPAPTKKRRKVGGYVYLLNSPSNYYKIGRSKDPHSRKATFDIKLPFEVEFEHIIKTNDMIELEEQLHLRFAHCRVNGEWFDLSADDVAYIKSIGGEA
jgi:hypothetical protein